jgi:pilus assembly protein TadC
VITEDMIKQLESEVRAIEADVADGARDAAAAGLRRIEITAREWGLLTDELMLVTEDADALERTRNRLVTIAGLCDRLARLPRAIEGTTRVATL